MRLVHLAPALALFPGAALAQVPLLTVQTESAGPAAICADLDGDGRRDLLVGDPGGYPLVPRPGEVHAFSGSDGALIRTYFGEQPGDLFGSTVEVVGDLDGDSLADFAFGAPGSTAVAGHRPFVVVVSARSGAPLLRIEGPEQSAFGSGLALLDDVDGDGHGDLAVAASGTATYGQPEVPGFVRVVSLASGTALWRTGPVLPGGQAVAVARLADRDGDGRGEVAAGFAALARVEVRSGRDGALLQTLTPPAGAGFGYGTGFGAAVDAADLDGDDVEDLLVGAPYEAITYYGGGSYEGYLHHGAVYALSGASGAVLHRVTAYVGQTGFGTSVAALGDFDGDGRRDYVTGNTLQRTGCCLYHPGSASVYSGPSGAVLQQYSIGTGGLYADAGDWNGDGLGDYVVSGIPPQYQASEYTTWIVAGQHPLPAVDPACAGSAAGCTPGIGAVSAASASSEAPFTLVAWGFKESSRGLLLLGLEKEFTPFGAGALCVGRPTARLPAVSYEGYPPGACSGGMYYSFAPAEVGSGLLPVGATVYGQFVSLYPALPPGSATRVRGLSEGVAIPIWP